MKRRTAVAFVLAGIFLLASLLPVSGAAAMDELQNNDPEKYYIVLDLNNQIVFVYEQDDEGAYTVLVRCFLCTTGRTELDPNDPEDEGSPTPKGIWKIGGRERFGKFANFSREYARYWTQIVGSIYFHSIMFGDRTVNSMKRSAFNNLGSNVSHGCVRLYVEDAKWLYYNACPGTTIHVTDSLKKNSKLKKALRTSLSFSDYNALQKTFYDGPELPNPKAWVVTEGVRMRKGCGNDFDSVAKLTLGQELEVLLEGEAWVKVSNGKREGYVRRGYITMQQGEFDTKEDARLIKATVWMYEAADTDSERLVKVPTDTSVKVLEELEGGWTKIAYWNETGYIRTSSLKTGWGKIMD